MLTVKQLYDDLKKMMEEGLGQCQLYGVASPYKLKEIGKMHDDGKAKWINVTDDENW
jgi:hypothetical protein